MSFEWVDVDGAPSISATEATCGETWVVDRQPAFARRSSSPGSPSAGGRIRRQFVFTPSRDPWDAVTSARRAMDAGAPRVLRLFPGPLGHRYPLVDWALAPLPAVCEREGFGLAVDYGPQGAIPLADVST